jgi:hypothetical protein
MPRFIRVQLQCDWAECDTVGDEGDGIVAPMTVAIDGKPGKEFLLCKPHRDTVDELIMPLMQKGTKVEPAKRSKSPGGGAPATGQPSPVPATGGGQKAENVECKVDGCGRTLHNRTGMAQHVIRTHNYPSLAAYEAEFGTID